MKEFLNKIYKVDDEIIDEYLSLWKPYSLEKKTIMTREGETEKYMYYVLEGIQKSYHINKDKEHITAFTYAPSFSGIPDSFLNQSPAKYYLETITKSEFLRITYANHQAMLTKHRALETLFRKATEQLLIDILSRYNEMMAFDMETRFKTFTNRSPHLLQMLPQKDLASYLKIDPTNFSKLMGKVKI